MTTTTITGLPNAATPLSGAERVPLDQTIDAAIAASALVAGTGYRIESVGNTNWTACGLPAGVTAAVGLPFVATAAGTGTGTAIAIETRDAAVADIAALAPGTNLTYDAATRLLSSSTGADVTLPLAGEDAGLISAADQAKLTSIVVDRARLTVADVRNNSGVSIPKGAPVYVTSSSGTTKTVALADASLEATAANTLGLAADTIANNSDGLVITEGPLMGLSTAGLTEGQLIWLSETTGAITSTRPTQPAHGVVLGWCVKAGAGSAGILYVKVDNGLELNELHDVLITSPATGQVLRRAADGLWKNAALDVGDVANAVATNDARLSDARTPLAHTQTASTISDFSAAVTGLFTTVGNALRSLVNPSAVSFLRLNADNSVTARSASEMRGDLGLGSAAQGTIGTTAGNVVALDGAGLIPSALLPGFVDDVLEYANIAAFPVTGETGKLYVSLATNRVYRWSGSIYIEIAASPGTTDAVTEGSVNLYFTNARARAAISVTGSLNYNPTTGVIAYTAPTLAVVATSGAYSDLTGRPTLANVATSGAYADLSGRPTLGTAAAGTIGTAAGNVVALDPVTAKLPAVDGSELTNLPAPSVADGTITDAKIAAAGLSQSSLNGSAITQWAPSTAYDKGALVSLQGIAYRRKTAGTTGATFDPTNWDQQTPTELSNSGYYTVGKYFNPSMSPSLANGSAIAGSIIIFYPFEVRRRVRINGCRVRVATAVAATTFQIAIYAASAANAPTGLPLVNTGDLSMAVATAVDSSLTSTWLEPGNIYFRAVIVSGGTTGVFTAHGVGSLEFTNLIGALSPLATTLSATSEYSLSWTYGTWPDMTSRTVAEVTSLARCPMVAFLVQQLG